MSDYKKIATSVLTVVFCIYFAIAGFIFTPYYNWQYAKDHGFVNWIFLGEVVPTLKAMVWPYFLAVNINNRTEDNKKIRESNNESKPWPDITESEKERIGHIWIKAKSELLTKEDLVEYKNVMIEYSNRVGRKFVVKDVNYFTSVFDMLYEYRNEFGKSMLNSIEKREPTFTHEYESVKNKLLEAGVISKTMVDEEKEMLIAAAKQIVQKDSGGIKHYPPTKDHVIEVMNKNNILKQNINEVKKVHYDMAKYK